MSTAAVEAKRLEDFPFDFAMEVCKASEGVGEEKGRWIVEGFAATTDLDLQNEEIEQGAIDDASKDLLKNSTVLLNHDDNRPIGKVFDAQAKPGGLFVKVEVSKSEPDIWTKVKEGVLNKFSIRGRILDAVRKWSDKLGRAIKVIRKMVLVETSLVSVPANPNARTLRWYVSKSLEEFAKSGGSLPVEGFVPEGEAEMSDQKGASPAPVTPSAAPAAPQGAATMDVKLMLDEAERKKISQVMFLVDRLLADEKDEKRRAVLTEIKALASRMAGGAYPYPAAGGVAASAPSSAPGRKDHLPEHIVARLGEALSPLFKKEHFEAIAALADELLKGETDPERKKALEEVQKEMGTEAPKTPTTVEVLSGVEKSSADAGVKAAVKVAQALCEPETVKKSDRVVHLMGLRDQLDAAIVKEDGGEVAVDKARHQPLKPMDGKCPEGYELKDGMCMWVGAKAKSEGGAIPPSAPTAPPPAMSPDQMVEAMSKALNQTLAPVVERLGKIEKTAGIKKSLDGQESLPEGDGKKDELGEVFRRVMGGALQRAGFSDRKGS